MSICQLVPRIACLKYLKYVANRVIARSAVVCRRFVYRLVTRLCNVQILRQKEDDFGTVIYRARVEDEVTHSKAVSNERPPYLRMVGRFLLDSPEVIVKRNVTLIGEFATPVDEQGQILGYGVVPSNYREFLRHADVKAIIGACKVTQLKPEMHCDVACCLVNGWSTSYYHWVVEILPRVVLLLEAGLIEESTVLVIDKHPTIWQLRSLELLGVGNNIVRAGQTIRVDKLLIPDFPRVVPLGYSFSVLRPSMLRALRSRLTSVCNAEVGRRTNGVFISRAKSIGRRILNEDELSDALARLGFVRYCLEELGFEEQVRLFATADRIVGPHGAGLANMLWSSDSRVCEIYGAGWNASFYTLANSLGIEYFLYKCRAARSFSPKRADLIVEVGDFTDFLTRHMPG
jgi:capsular polysaccharide biosynthesis protein